LDVDAVLELLARISDLVFEGVSHKLIKLSLTYLVNQVLIQLDQLREFSQLLKALSIMNNTLIFRVVDNPLLMRLVIDALNH